MGNDVINVQGAEIKILVIDGFPNTKKINGVLVLKPVLYQLVAIAKVSGHIS